MSYPWHLSYLMTYVLSLKFDQRSRFNVQFIENTEEHVKCYYRVQSVKSSLWKNLDKNNSVSSTNAIAVVEDEKTSLWSTQYLSLSPIATACFSHNTVLLWTVLVYRYFPAIKCVMIPFPLLNLVIFNFWHFKYSVSWCGSLSSSLELSECPRTRCLFLSSDWRYFLPLFLHNFP